jgi:menaquinol-cytochrome c reductase cytochrome b/c subunit
MEIALSRRLISPAAVVLALVSVCLYLTACGESSVVLTVRQPAPSSASEQKLVPVPPALARAGGRELGKFDAGMEVVAQSGCLACHRIGEQGNPGPGSDLTRIGARLSKRQIEHAILDPTAPMPSFSHFPPAKLSAVVTFLELLR